MGRPHQLEFALVWNLPAGSFRERPGHRTQQAPPRTDAPRPSCPALWQRVPISRLPSCLIQALALVDDTWENQASEGVSSFPL